MNTKQCNKCKEIKPATNEYFGRNKLGRNGLRSHCKACAAESSAKWYEVNKERHAEVGRAWRADNKEHAFECDRKWREANKERQAENVRKWYEANKERKIETDRIWREANPEIQRAKDHRRRARKRNAKGTHTAADVELQYKSQRGKCYYCKCNVGDKYHVDHVVPLTRGGSNGPENLVIACSTCNTSKGARLPHEWSRGGRLL